MTRRQTRSQIATEGIGNKTQLVEEDVTLREYVERKKAPKKVVIVTSTLLHYFFMHCPWILFLILWSNVFNYLIFLCMNE